MTLERRSIGILAGLVGVLGGAVVFASSCSPSSPGISTDASVIVCDPDSGDPAGCACTSTSPTGTCYTGPAGTEAKGICKTGTRACVDGVYTACVGEVTPQPEVCNYADDDCDGIVDDLPQLSDAAILATCNSPACSPDFQDAAITCWGPDPGICGAGVKTCAGGPGGGTPTGCNEFIHTPAQEVCNGVDDDCNGLIDDGLDNDGPCDMAPQSSWPDGSDPFDASADGSRITRVYGECIHGNLTCVDTNCGEHSCADASDTCFPSQPTSETQQYGAGCDGLDNDCNGIVDDHACADTFDVQYGQIYCCNDGTFYDCDTKADISEWTSCKLAN